MRPILVQESDDFLSPMRNALGAEDQMARCNLRHRKRVDAIERAIARRVTREQEDGMRAVMDAIHKVTNVTLVDRNRKS